MKRQTRIQRAASNVQPSYDRVIQEKQNQAGNGGKRTPRAARLQKVKTCPGRCDNCGCCRGNVSDLSAREHQPKAAEPGRSQSRARPTAPGGVAGRLVWSSRVFAHARSPRSASHGIAEL